MMMRVFHVIGLDAFIGNKPKLNIFPKSTSSESSLIELSNQNYRNLTYLLGNRMSEYDNETRHKVPCVVNGGTQEEMIPEDQRWKRVCSINVRDTTENTGFGVCAMGHDHLLSGFKDGKPCFMLVFNKILGVAPKSKLRNGIDSVNSCHSEVVPIKYKSDVSNVSSLSKRWYTKLYVAIYWTT
uniref:Uncharacterized protein n=1 Tax=Panagrolaimus sp. JU765 TaxID=591449 RepID=A0AC34RC76_9BILA